MAFATRLAIRPVKRPATAPEPTLPDSYSGRSAREKRKHADEDDERYTINITRLPERLVRIGHIERRLLQRGKNRTDQPIDQTRLHCWISHIRSAKSTLDAGMPASMTAVARIAPPATVFHQLRPAWPLV
ncbi:MAG: hypothetical protein ABI274_00820 [Ktedonobacterales bacterium]